MPLGWPTEGLADKMLRDARMAGLVKLKCGNCERRMTGTEIPLWVGRFDATGTGIFAVQDSITNHILPVVTRLPNLVPTQVQLIRIYSEKNQPQKAAKTAQHLRKIALEYSPKNAARMFPYPDKQHRIRLQSALRINAIPEA